MAIFDHLFSGDAQAESRQLPDNLVNQAFGEVNIRRTAAGREVQFSVLIRPEAEGWQTGVALDASSSMLGAFGKMIDRSSIPAEAIQRLRDEGLAEGATADGRRRFQLTRQSLQRLREWGVEIKQTQNVIEPIAREFISYLAAELDEDGGTTVAYWACGPKGDEYEVLGDFTAEQCRTLKIAGPATKPFGDGTRLTPVMRYFVDRFPDARQGLYIFVTDGRLDDMNDLMSYTTQLARQIAAGKRNPVKCILIGVGSQIDASQMQQLDDLDTGVAVDIWDHKIAQEMRSMLTLFAELVDENRIVAPSGALYTSSGGRVQEFASGVPALIRFTMPAADEWFELEIAGQRIRQTVTFPDESKGALR